MCALTKLTALQEMDLSACARLYGPSQLGSATTMRPTPTTIILTQVVVHISKVKETITQPPAQSLTIPTFNGTQGWNHSQATLKVEQCTGTGGGAQKTAEAFFLMAATVVGAGYRL